MSNVVNLYTALEANATNPRVFQYDLDKPGSEIIADAVTNCQLPNDQQYSVLVKLSPQNQMFLEPNMTLRSIGVTNGMQIQIMGKDKPIVTTTTTTTTLAFPMMSFNQTIQPLQQPGFPSLPGLPAFPAPGLPAFPAPTTPDTQGQQAQPDSNQFGSQQGFNSSTFFTQSVQAPMQMDMFASGIYGGFGYGALPPPPGVPQMGGFGGFVAPEQNINQFQSGVGFATGFGGVADASQFQSGVGFAPPIPQQPIQEDNETDDISVFNSKVGFRVNFEDNDPGIQQLGDFNYDIVIDDNINDNINHFGAMKQKEDLSQTMEQQGFQGYEATCWDVFEPDKDSVVVMFYQSFDYNDVKKLCIKKLDLSEDFFYSFLFVSNQGDKYWLREGKSLERFQFTENTNLYIYHRDMKVKIYTTHYPPRMCTINAEKSVWDNVEDLAENFGIINYHGYTLFAREDGEDFPLDTTETVPEQTNCFRELAFRREWFVLSRIDIATMEAALQTYRDVKRRFFRDDLLIHDDIALEFAALQFYVEADNKWRKRPAFPEDISFLFPKSYKAGKHLGKKLEQFVKTKYDAPNQFNAIRRFLRLCRRYPGFGHLLFDVNVIVRTIKGAANVQSLVEITPYSVLIYDMETNTLQDRISYTKIVKSSFADNTLTLMLYVRPGLVASYEFTGENSLPVKVLIERYIAIMKGLMLQRAKNTSLLPKNIRARNRLVLPTSKDLTVVKGMYEFVYDRNYTGMLLVKVAAKHLQMRVIGENAIALIKIADGLYRYVYKNDILALLSIQNGMPCYIIERMTMIKLTYSDGRTRQVKLDITKPIEDLTKDAFAAIGFPPLTGFTFWQLNENKELAPLDVRFSIPEQTPIYNHLHLLRRFYTLSGEILQNSDVAKMTMMDTIPLIVDGLCPVTDEEALEYAVLYTYSFVVSSTDEVETLSDFSYLKKILPPTMPYSPQVVKQFRQYLNRYPAKEKMPAMRAFLGKVRKLPGFGCEAYHCQFCDITPGVRMKVHKDYNFTLAPLYIMIGPVNSPMPRYQVAYRFILNYEMNHNYLIIRFIADEKGTVVHAKMRFKETIDTVFMMLGYNIKILNDLILMRELKKKKAIEEMIRRLRGGFIDEKGRIHGPQVDFFVTKDPMKLENLPRYWIDLNYTGEKVVSGLGNILKLKQDMEYALLIRNADKQYTWIDKDQEIGSCSPVRGSILIILERYPPIKIIPIGTRNPQPQIMRLDMSKSLADNMPFITHQFELPLVPGLTLAYHKGTFVYLDSNRSIAEQASTNQDFYLVLRHFALPSDLITTPEMLYFIYCQTRACVLRGTYKLDGDEIIELMYYQTAVNVNGNPTIQQMPQNPKEWVPEGAKQPSVPPRAFEKLGMENPGLTTERGMRRYIDFARSCRAFSTQIFTVQYDRGFETRNKRDKHILYIGPEQMKISDESGRNILLNLNYCDLLETNSRFGEVAIKYRDSNLNVNIYNAISDEALTIYYLIKELQKINYQAIGVRAVNARSNGNIYGDGMSIVLRIVTPEFEKFEAPEIEFSLYMTGLEVVQRAIEETGIDSDQEWVGVLKVARGEYRYMNETDLLGQMNPISGLTLHLFHRITRVNVQDTDGKKDILMLDITQPLIELIPRIAERFFVEFWIGYTLYKDYSTEDDRDEIPNNLTDTMYPLDLTRPLPEQCINFQGLIFKRRFYTFTNDDAKGIDRRAFSEVREHILKSPVEMPENKAIELAIYSIFSDANNPDQAKQIQIKDTRKIMPLCIKPTQKTEQGVRDLLANSPKMQPLNAQHKYVATARFVQNFGCQMFDGNWMCTDPSKPLADPTYVPVCISIGPFGFHMFETSTKNDICKLSYDNIIQHSYISDRLVIKAATEGGSTESISIYTPNAQKANEIFEMYTEALVDPLISREQVQGLTEDPSFKAIIDSTKDWAIPLRCSSYVGNFNACYFMFNPNWYEVDAVRAALFYLGIKNDRPYIILHQDSKGNYKWLDRDKPIMMLQPEPFSTLYVVPAEVMTYTCTTFGAVTEIDVMTRPVIREAVQTACDTFELGNSFGFTFYQWSGDEQLPLDFLYSLPTETPHYKELIAKRRFYLITKNMMEDPNTVQSVFRDIVEQVLSGDNVIPLECAIELGICNLYANVEEEGGMEDLINNLDEETVQAVLPSDVEFDETIYDQFITAFQNHVMMDVPNAIYRYACICNCISDFGAEYYEVMYVNNTDEYPKPPRKVLVCLSVSSVTIQEAEDGTRIQQIYYSNLISHVAEYGSVNLKFQDEKDMFGDITLENNHDAPLIESYINDILDMYRMMFENHWEIMFDEEIDLAALGLMRQEVIVQEAAPADAGDVIGGAMFDFNDIGDIDAEINQDYMNLKNINDVISLDFDNEDIKDLMNENNKAIENAGLGVNLDELTWKADTDYLDAERKERFLDDFELSINEISNGLEETDTAKLANEFEKMKNELSMLNLNEDDQELLELQDTISDLFAQMQQATITAAAFEDMQPIVEEQLNKAIVATKGGKEKKAAIKEKIVTRKKAKKAQTKKDDKGDALTQTLVAISEIEERLAKNCKDNAPLLALLTKEDPVKLEEAFRNNSTELVKVASDIDENGRDDKTMVKLLAPISDLNKHVSGLEKIVSTAKSSNIPLPGISDDYVLLVQLSRNLENLGNKTQQEMAAQDPDAAKKRQYQVYLGNHNEVQGVTKELAEIADLANQLKGITQVQEDPALANYLAIAIPRIQSALNNLRKLISALNQNPTNEAARSAAVNSLWDTRDTLTEFYNTLKPIGTKDPSANKTLAEVAQVLPIIDDALSRISTANVTSDNLEEASKSLKDFLNYQKELPPEVFAALDQKSQQEMAQAMNAIVPRLQRIDELQKMIDDNPTNGELIMAAQTEMLALKAETRPLLAAVRVAAHKSNNKKLVEKIDKAEKDIDEVLLEKRAGEDVAKTPHLATFQQTQVQNSRLENQINALLDNDKLDSNQKKKLKGIKNKLKKARKKQNATRKELRKRAFNPEYLNEAMEEQEEVRDIVDELTALMPDIVEICPEADQLAKEAIITSSLNNTAIEQISKADLGKFRKPPEKEAVEEIEKNIKDQIEMLKKLRDSDELKNKPKIKEELEKRIKSFEDSLEPLAVQSIDPNVDYIPLAEKLRKKIQKTRNLCNSIQEFKKSPDYANSMDQTLSNLDYSLRETPPTSDLAQRCIIESIPPIQRIHSVITELASRPTIQADPVAFDTIKNWAEALENANYIIQTRVSRPDCDESDIIAAKDALAVVNAKISQIPPELRDKLTNIDFNNLGRAICATRNHSGVAVNCVRLLPTVEKLSIDVTPFKQINTTGDPTQALNDLAQQLEAFYAIADQIEKRPQTQKNAEHLNIARDMKQRISINTKPLQNVEDDHAAIEVLSQLKQNMPGILSDANQLTAAINNDKLATVAKTVSDNTTRSHAMMTRPHLTKASAAKITKSLIDQINEVQPLLDATAQLPDMKKNKELSAAVDDVRKTMAEYKKNLPKMTTEQQQNAIDDLYSKVAAILPQLSEIPGNIATVDKLEHIYTTCDKYTTAARVPVKVAALLIPTKSKKEDEDTQKKFKDILKACDRHSLKDDDVAKINSALSDISKTKKGLPNHVIVATSGVAPTIVPKASSVNASDAGRIVAISAGDPEARRKMLEDLAVKNSINAAKCYPDLRTGLSNIEEELIKGAEASPEFIAAYQQLQKDVRDSDPALLLDTKNMPSAVIAYQGMHNVDTSAKALIEAAKGNKQLEAAIKKLNNASDEFSDWMHQTDMTMEAIIEANADRLVADLEEIVQADELGKLPESTHETIRAILPELKDSNRGLIFDPAKVASLTKTINEFNDNQMPIINRSVNDCAAKTDLANTINDLQAIKPITRIWASPLNAATPEEVRNVAEGDLLDVSKNISEMRYSKNPIQAKKALKNAKAKVKHLKKKLKKAPNNSKTKKALEKIDKLEVELEAQENAEKPSTSASSKLLGEALDLIKDISPILAAQIVASPTSITQTRLNDNLKAIDDKNAKETADIAAKQVMMFQVGLDNAAPEDAGQDVMDEIAAVAMPTVSASKKLAAKKNTKAAGLKGKKLNKVGLREALNAKKKKGPMKKRKAITPNELKLSSDPKELTKSIIENNKAQQKKSGEVTHSITSPQVTQDLIKNLISENHKLALVNRFGALRQQQATAFPDASRPTKLAQNVNESDIQNAISSLQTQMEFLDEPEKLAEIQASLTPADVQLQQLILTDSARLSLQPEARLPVAAQLTATKNAEDELLDAVVIKQASSPITPQIVSPNEMQRTMSRGMAMANLATKLQGVQTELLKNNPDLYRFAKTGPGLNALGSQLSTYQVMDHQKNLAQDLDLISNPEMLRVRQQAMPAVRAIEQTNVIGNLIDILAGPKGSEILSNPDIDPNEDAILEALNIEQLGIAAENPELLKASSIADPVRAMKAEEFNLDTIGRLDLVQRLATLQQQQARISEHANTMNTAPDMAAIQSPAAIQREIPSIYAQLSQLNNPDNLIKMIKGLTPEQLTTQQQILHQLANIIAVPATLDMLKSNAGSEADKASPTDIMKNANRNIMGRLALHVIQREFEELVADPIQLYEIIPTSDLSPMQALQAIDTASTAATRASDLSTLLAQIERANPKIALNNKENMDAVEKNLDGKKLDAINDNIVELEMLLKSAPEHIEAYIEDLPEVDQLLAFNVLAAQVNDLKDAKDNNMLEKCSKSEALQNNVFDRAALLQLSPNGIETPKGPIDLNAKENMKALMADITGAEAASRLIDLERARISVAPGIADANIPEIKDKISEMMMNVDTIKKMQDCIREQLSMVDKPEKLKASIAKSSPEQMVLQQMMVADAAKLAEVPEIVMPVVAKLDPTKDDPSSERIVSKVIDEILSNQADSMKRSPALLEAKIPSTGDIIKIQAENAEEKERAKLAQKLNATISALSDTNPEAAKLLKKKEGIQEVTKLPFTPEEISFGQETIKDLVNAPSIELAAKKVDIKDPKMVARLILLVDNLKKTVVPQSEIQTGKSKAKSIFTKPVTIDPSLVSVKPLDAKSPSLQEVFSNLVQAATNVVEKVPEVTTRPVADVRTTLARNVADAMKACNEMLSNKDAKYMPEVGILVELAPELITGMTRFLPTVPKNVRAELIEDPANILNMISEIQRNSINLENPDSYSKYRNTLMDLNTELAKVNATLVDVKFDPIASAANLAAAIDAGNTGQMNSELAKIESARIQSVASGDNKKQIASLVPVLDKLKPALAKAECTLPSQKVSLKPLTEVRPQLVKIIAKETQDPFAAIASITKPSDVKPILATATPLINTGTDNLVHTVAMDGCSSTNDSIEQLIKGAADSQAAILKGIDVQNVESIPVYLDTLSSLSNSMSSLGNIISATKTATANPVLIRRCQRALNRMVDQMKEQMEDASKKPEKKQTKLDKQKLEFMKGATNTVQGMMTALSARASAKVPENYSQLIEKQLPVIKQNIEDLKKQGAALQKANTDKNTSAQFNKELDQLMNTFNQFTSQVNDSKDSSLLDVAGCLIDVSGALATTVGTVSRMTDKENNAPDISSSEKIPSRFNMPPADEIDVSLRAAEAFAQLQAASEEYKKLQSEFVKASQNPKVSNQELVDRMNALVEKMRALMVLVLTLSAITNDFEMQSEMMQQSNKLVLQFNLIIRILRQRFLNSCDDWDGKIGDITKRLNTTNAELLKDAEKIAQAEADSEEFKKLFGLKFANALKPLSEAQQLVQADSQVSNKLEKGDIKEWTGQALDISCKMGDSVMKVFQFLKEKPNKKIKADSLLDFATALTQQLVDIDAKVQEAFSKRTGPEQFAFDTMKPFAGLQTKFNESTSGADIPGLKDAVISCCKAADKLAKNAEAALKSKKGGKKASTDAKKELINITVCSEDDLMRRLILESKVIKARHLLGRFENQLSTMQ